MKAFHINTIAGTALLAGALFAAGCESITDTQKEWIEQGETIYVGRLDSLRVRPGFGRALIEGDTRYVRTATTCTVEVGEKKFEYAIADIVDDDGVARILIEGLEAGSHYFYVTNYDDAGGKSLTTEVFGKVYGEEDMLVLRPRRAETITPHPDGSITLGWSEVENVEKMELSYEAADGTVKSLTLPGDETSTLLPSWRLGGLFTTKTFIRQNEDDLDAFELEPVAQNFPEEVEFEVAKSKFKLVELPTDTKGNSYAGTSCGVRGLWDGVWNPYEGHAYHTSDGEGVPHHCTFDMGVKAKLSKVWLAGRTDGYIDWNPKRWQLWGRETLDGAETALPSLDAGWDAEAREKGWVLLGEFESKETIYNEFEIADAPDNIRYLRFRVTEVYGGGAHTGATGTGVYGCVAEISLWASSIDETLE